MENSSQVWLKIILIFFAMMAFFRSFNYQVSLAYSWTLETLLADAAQIMLAHIDCFEFW